MRLMNVELYVGTMTQARMHCNFTLTKALSFHRIKYFSRFKGMIFSMCGLMMKLKWCAWIALYCSCISFANSRASDDAKQVKI